MLNTICNDYLEISVKNFGAVLTNITSQKTGFQFLWQGNPDVWNGQSPILFPIIGRLLDDKYSLNGQEYSLIRHGVARHYEFDLFSQKDDELVFVQYANNETIVSYPFDYKLMVSFRLEGNKLIVKHSVKNCGDDNMYFSIGAHPAFNCHMGDTVVFDKNETQYCERIDTNSILIEHKDLILDNSNTITLEPHLFDDDALIFSSLESKGVTLNLKEENKQIRMEYDSPFFAVWAKPNAPFVCLEPWYGINDSYDKVQDISQKRGIVSLAPHSKFVFEWNAQFSE